MIRLLLINTNRSALSHDMVDAIARGRSVDSVVATEPNRKEAAKSSWLADVAGDVAIRDYSGRLPLALFRRDAGIVSVELPGTLIVAVYITPNCELEEFTARLEKIRSLIRSSNKKVALLGDFNAKTVAAGSPSTNKSGAELAELMQQLYLTCINTDAPTYSARGHSSVLDLVILDDRWNIAGSSAKVLAEETASDYLAVLAILKERGDQHPDRRRPGRIGPNQALEVAHKIRDKFGAEDFMPQTLQSAILETINSLQQGHQRPKCAYWWNPEIKHLRSELIAARRDLQRQRRSAVGQQLVQAALKYGKCK